VHWGCHGNSSHSNHNKSQSVELLSDSMDEDVHMRDACARVQCGHISVSVTPSSRNDLHSVCNSTSDSSCCLHSSLHVTHIPMLSDNDAKKRPLSVSSTSSSVSSSSSLPRHQRKKIATMTTFANSLSVDQYCDWCKHANDCPHKTQRSDNFAQCTCAQSTKEGQLRHVCRVHGPSVDVSVAKSVCPNCNHSRVGFTAEHSHICDIREVNEASINDSDTHSDNRSIDLNRSASDPGGGSGHQRSPSAASHSHRFVLDLVGSYLGKVTHEILETERIYVTDLRDILQVTTLLSYFYSSISRPHV
jgi:hypothetical protein